PSVRQTQTRPRPCLGMKLIASGVANWAAMTRSPSFSRSGASTTTTNRPCRMSSIASSTSANGVTSRTTLMRAIVSASSGSAGERLPHELRHVEHDLPVAHLAGRDAEHAVEPRVAAVGAVDDRRDDAALRLGLRLAAAGQGEEDRGAVAGLDRAVERRQVAPVGAPAGPVRGAEASRDAALRAPLGEEQQLVAGAERLRVAKAQAVERLEPHPAGSSRSTYFATTSTSRFTGAPGRRSPSVVAASVCGTSATSKASSSRDVIVSATPWSVIDPFSTQ